ncbi:MAG: P-loop NTPase fold protein [Bacteroidales bacterium]|nr:P-loop NTPase fold protein [Bacteroidales bacterium]
MANNNKYINTLKRHPKSDRILLFLFILLSFIYAEASESIYIWLNKQEKDFWMNVIYSFINNKPLINIFICIAIVYLTFLWARKIWQDKDIRLYRTPIAVFCIVILNYKSDIYYADIICNFSYQCFLTIILSSILAIILIKLIREIYRIWKINKQNKEPELKGFSVDNTEIKLEDNQIKYAETLVKKLKNTDLSKESFAVGITGEWGSGKSTFLNTMKEKIGKDFAEIVEFNPWLCNSPEQVTQDFFATLIDKLSPKHSTLSRDINKYAKLLNKIAKPSLSIFGIDLDLTPGDDSLDELKENISDKLANLPKKVVILIDDTDRLEGNEVFEILRLIRNTADFKNVIYIATYDKEYVTDVLEKNKINDPDNYLEKIFQTEVHLLKVEGSELWKTLMKEIEANISLDYNVIRNIYSYPEITERQELIFQVLGTFRQIKIFARQFTVYLDCLNKNGSIENFSFLDLFWLELLQTYDKKVYDILAKDRYSLLKRYNNSDDVYKLRPLNYNRDWKEKTEEILTIIFPGTNKVDDIKRMRFLNNYYNYFTLQFPKKQLSLQEMEKILNVNNPITIVQQWLENNKDYNSIISLFTNNKIDFNNTTYLKNYIFGLLYFAFYYNGSNYNSSSYPNDIKQLLQQERYSNHVDAASKIAKSWLEEVTEKYHEYHLLLLTTLLNKLHARTKEEKDYKLIISNETMKYYLRKIIEQFIEHRSNWPAIDILRKRYVLRGLFEDCCVQFFDENGNEYYKQIALDIVIDHFSEKANKPTFEEFDKVYKENFEYDNMTDDERNKIDIELTKLFGSNYKEHIQTFKQTCFIQN